MPTVQKLISQLPPYQDHWELIHPNQTVKDIMAEILEAHQEFAPYYENISSFFDEGDTEEICNNIYFFLKDNIRYKEETEHGQTSALPTGILTRLHGDCKHYAGFTAGILDALNRQGHKIKWCYVFASYKALDSSPHHVFVEVDDNGKKIWIDPTPGADSKQPAWITRKKIKAVMPLHRNIAGIQTEFLEVDENGQMIGKRPFWQLMPAQGARGADGNRGTNPYFTGPFLGLEHYLEDPYSAEGTDWTKTSDAINQAIAQGPEPGHAVDPDFAKWIYTTSNKAWNFYYPMGVPEGYVPAQPLPRWYPKLVLSPDGKLQFDRFYKIDDYMNNEIHGLTAWAQAMILQNALENGGVAFPITPRALKEFSQGKNGDDLFVEDRGVSDLKKLWKGFAWWNLYSMRGAYLNLVRANWFHLGKKLWDALHNDDGSIDNDAYNRLQNIWTGAFGGKMDHLITASENGRFKPAVNSKGEKIGEAWTLAAIAAAAAVVITAMGTAIGAILKEKNKDKDEETGQTYPPIVIPPTTGGGGGFDINTIIAKIKANPLPWVAGGVGLAFLLSKKKGASVKGIGGDIVVPALLLYGAWYFFMRPKQQGLTVQQMREALYTVQDKVKEWVEYVGNLADNEIEAVYLQYFK